METSPTVTVYSFKIIGASPHVWIQAPYKASRQTIEQLGGDVLEGTHEEVDATLLDEEGLYRRLPTGWGELV